MAYRGVSAYARRVLSGPFALAAALLAVGGAMKMVRPGPAAGALAALHIPAAFGERLMGGAELIAGSAALVVGGQGAALMVAGFYLVFAAFVAMAISGRVGGILRLLWSGGCAPGMAHLVIDLSAAGYAWRRPPPHLRGSSTCSPPSRGPGSRSSSFWYSGWPPSSWR